MALIGPSYDDGDVLEVNPIGTFPYGPGGEGPETFTVSSVHVVSEIT